VAGEELERREQVTQESLVDSYGRQITYLRISLTELCNFRCVYCVPAEGLPVTRGFPQLTRSEITRFVRIIGTLGVHQIRLTGGEPLLRQDIVDIIRSLKTIETVKDLSITTNGSRLAPMVASLKHAGLDRINISLDSVDPKRFLEITRSDAYGEVLNATFQALRAGFPVKLNMVAMKGLSRREIIQFMGLAQTHPLEVRFLEFMPLCGTGWGPDYFLPISEVRSIAEEHFDLVPEHAQANQVAETFRIRNGKGKVGFIASLTESFCDRCSRIRLSSDGKIFPCLFSGAQVSVIDLLRDKAPDKAIIEALREAARIKPRGNQFRDNPYQSGDERQLNCDPSPLIHNLGG